MIKHNIAKFIGDYGIVVIFCEFGTLAEDICKKHWNCTNQNTSKIKVLFSCIVGSY